MRQKMFSFGDIVYVDGDDRVQYIVIGQLDDKVSLVEELELEGVGDGAFSFSIKYVEKERVEIS